jgi:hypothetical protein
MSIVMDRLKASFYSLVHAATSRLAYAAPRIARVVSGATAADGSTTLDLVPEDPTFPPMAGVPLFHGAPGESITLATGTRACVEFSEADPARPLARSWAGGETVAVRTLTAQTLNLGGLGALPAIVGPPFLTALGTLLAAINAYAVAIQGIADPTDLATPVLTAAIQAFNAAATSALAKSAKVL